MDHRPTPRRASAADPKAGAGCPGRWSGNSRVVTAGRRCAEQRGGHGHAVHRDRMASPGSCGRLGQGALALGHRRPGHEPGRADQRQRRHQEHHRPPAGAQGAERRRESRRGSGAEGARPRAVHASGSSVATAPDSVGSFPTDATTTPSRRPSASATPSSAAPKPSRPSNEATSSFPTAVPRAVEARGQLGAGPVSAPTTATTEGPRGRTGRGAVSHRGLRRRRPSASEGQRARRAIRWRGRGVPRRRAPPGHGERRRGRLPRSGDRPS